MTEINHTKVAVYLRDLAEIVRTDASTNGLLYSIEEVVAMQETARLIEDLAQDADLAAAVNLPANCQ